jgi:Mor family transcriptional regulator
MARSRDSALVEDLILSCAGEGIASETVQKAIRALCRYYGGQMIYIPVKEENGTSAEKLRIAMMDAVDEGSARTLLARIMRLYGGMQVYIPLERCAFRTTIALEIYERYDQRVLPMTALAREYNISANYAYVLWKRGRHEKLKPALPYLPFLELAEINNQD